MSERVGIVEGPLAPALRSEVLALAAERGHQLGREALTEQARRAIATGEALTEHLVARHGDRLVGYALLTMGDGGLELELLGDEVDDELVALAAALAEQRSCGLSIWIHGNRGELSAPLAGLRATRVIDRLRRGLPAPAPPEPPAGVSLRPFEVGRDEERFLAVNARSFAHHPDQGSMDFDDLRAKEAEAWFDPSGFLLAERDGALVGFCWTKLHRDPWGERGEIYVIGVDPAAAGLGLGRLLLRAGLADMAGRGIKEAILYVESDNEAARGLYDAEGFSLEWRDARFATRAP
jgi:mycothiol synthase